MTARFIAIAGNIGAGKSTLVGFLARQFDLLPLYEPVSDNPYIEDFYKSMERWALNSQIFYLSRKFALHLEAQKSERRVLIDRTIYEDAEIFVENLYRSRFIQKRDYDTYNELYRTIRSELQPPDLLIYLRCSVRGARRRIRKRARESEMAIPLPYIRSLHALYEAWFERYDIGPKAVIETEELDYLRNIFDHVEFIQQIERLLS